MLCCACVLLMFGESTHQLSHVLVRLILPGAHIGDTFEEDLEVFESARWCLVVLLVVCVG
jgi:hypothetical protein